MNTPAQRHLAERQLKVFERQILQAAEAMHEADPQGTADRAISLAGHAALGVACDPGLLHLLRINFFFDRDPLPHWVEARLLLSPLCHEEGDDLYAMDAALRDLLLQRLAAREGPARLRSVATLLWQYTERHPGWQDRRELRHAQQLTALSFLAPDKARAWLDEADAQRGRGRLDETWFIAMRADLPRLPAVVKPDGHPEQVFFFLSKLLPDWLRSNYADVRRSSKGCQLLGGLASQARRWLVFQFLLFDSTEPPLLQEFAIDGQPGSQLLRPVDSTGRPALPVAGLPTLQGSDLPAGTNIVVNGVERLGIEEMAACCRYFEGCSLFLIDTSGRDLNDVGLQLDDLLRSSKHYRPPYLWQEHRYHQEELLEWLTNAGPALWQITNSIDSYAPVELASELIATSEGGTPERLFEQICLRTGVRWPDVIAEAAACFRSAPNTTQVLENLAADYERIRATQSSGEPRTAAMEAVVRQMREAMQPEPHQPLQVWQESGRTGQLLLAVVLLRLQPSAQACAWLGELMSSRQPFLGFHAALALREAASTLPDDQLDTVAAAVEVAVKRLGISRLDKTDRGAVLKLAHEILNQRRRDRQPNLTKLPLLIWNQTLLPGATRSLSAPFASSLKVLDPPFVAVFGAALDRKSQQPVFGTLVSADFRKTERGGLDIVGDRRVRLLSFGEHDGGLATASVEFEETREDEHFDSTVWDRLVRAGHALSRVEPRTQPPFEVSRTLAGAYAIASWVNQDDPAAAYEVLAVDKLQDRLQYLELLAIERIRRALRAPVTMTDAQQSRYAAIIRRLHMPDVLQRILKSFRTDRSHLLSQIKPLTVPGRNDTVLAAALAASPQDEELWAFAEPWLRADSKPRQPNPEKLKLWPNGSTLRIRFLAGSQTLRKRVIEAASPWFEHANLHYRVLGATSKEEAEIRIGFDESSNSWSYLGTDALTIPQDEQTMNLHLPEDKRDPDYLRTEVLMQFGHALGLIPEHRNPNAHLEWVREAAIKRFKGPPYHWSTKEIEMQMFTPTNVADYRPFDPRSVMLHYLPSECMRNGKAIGGASVLSVSDKRLISKLYPPSKD